MLINEYNRAMDYRGNLRTSLITTRGISFGTIITLIAALFAQVILVFWIYLLIIGILLFFALIYLIVIQVKLNERIEKIDNYSNYIQILLRKVTLENNPDKINEFIPFSFTLEYIGKQNKSLRECLDQFNTADPEKYLKYKEPVIKAPKNRSIVIQAIAGITGGIITVIAIIFFILNPPSIPEDPILSRLIQEGILIPIVTAVIGGILGLVIFILKRRLLDKN